MLTFEEIKQLIDLVCERQLQTFEIERSGFRLRIDGQSAAAQSPLRAAVGVTPVQALPAAGEQGRGEAEAEAGQSELPPGSHVLKSPIVGTFYAAPSPGADPYVQVGDKVEKGQIMCIVEAMKLMNEIEADADGEVVEVFPDNAQPVEFGEPLFAIRTG